MSAIPLRVTLRRVARLIAAGELPIVIAAAPLLLFPTLQRVVVVAVFPIIWACAKIAWGHWLPPTPMNAPLMVLSVMVGVSVLVTEDIGFSLGKVSGIVLGLALFWAVARWLTTPVRLRWATTAFVTSGVALAIIGLLGSSVPDTAPWMQLPVQPPKLIRGIPGAEAGFNPNAVAGLLLLFIPLQIVLLVSGSGRLIIPTLSTVAKRLGTALQLMLLLPTCGALLYLNSRGAWAGAATAGTVALIAQSRRARLITAALLATSAAVVVALGPGRVWESSRSNVGPDMAYTIAMRTEIWSRALSAIVGAPLTGIGMNMFRRTMQPLSPSLEVGLDGKGAGHDVVHAHNQVLQTALDVGVPGVVAYLSLWLLAAVILIKTYRHAVEVLHRSIAAGLGIGLLAHFCFGLTDAIALGAKAGILFWWTLAFIVGLYKVAFVEHVPAAIGHESRR